MSNGSKSASKINRNLSKKPFDPFGITQDMIDTVEDKQLAKFLE